MYNTSELWKQYQSHLTSQYEYKVVIGGEEYLMDSIESLSINRSLCEESALTIGNVFAAQLSLSVLPHDVAIPRMASVLPYVRMSGEYGYTDWMPLGVFYIDTRKKQGLRLMLECYDGSLMMDTPFVIEGETLEYPIPMREAVSRICNRLGVNMANLDAIKSDFNMEYPNNLTVREVAGYIASANAGNFTFDYSGKLKLVVPTNDTSVSNVSVGSVEVLGDAVQYQKVTMLYTDTDAFSSGDGYEMVLDNPWATQAIADYVASKLSTYTHAPFEATKAYIDPSIELGDTVTILGNNYVVYTQDVKYFNHVVASISSPGGAAIDHEYPYTGSMGRAFNRTVRLGQPYYGVSISRDKGLHVQKTDGESVVGEAVFNSDTLAMRAMIGGQLRDCIYFDASSQKYRLTGDVIIDGSVSSDATVTDALYAEQGDISQLTVDWLDTSKRVKRYLLKDVSNDDYITAHDSVLSFVSASVLRDDDGEPLTEHLVNRYGSALYWQKDISDAELIDGYPYIDGQRVYTTEETTKYPVIVYQYQRLVKRAIDFVYDIDSGIYLPTDVFGVGTSLDHPTYGKMTMTKRTNGFVMEYITSQGIPAGAYFRDDGFVDWKGRRADILVDTSKKCFVITPEGSAGSTYTIEYEDTANGLKLKWPDGDSFMVEVI